jgi:hypothetical protein
MLIGIVIGLIVGCWLGYRFAIFRFQPSALANLINIQNKVLSGEMTTEDGLKELGKIEPRN